MDISCSENMADVIFNLRLMYLKVIAIVNQSSSEGPSGHTNRRNSVFMRNDRSGYQNAVKLTYLRAIVLLG